MKKFFRCPRDYHHHRRCKGYSSKRYSKRDQYKCNYKHKDEGKGKEYHAQENENENDRKA